MTEKNYAIIENNIVVDMIVLSESDCQTEEQGIAFVRSLGFGESKCASRPESPTEARIGDQFNDDLGRFQDDPDVPPPPKLIPVDVDDLTKGWTEDLNNEFFYNDSGRWEPRDIQES